jgi:hypothetical protein
MVTPPPELPVTRKRRLEADSRDRRARTTAPGGGPTESSSKRPESSSKRPAKKSASLDARKRFKSPTPASLAALAIARRRNDATQGSIAFSAREKYPAGCKLLLDESIYPTPSSVRHVLSSWIAFSFFSTQHVLFLFLLLVQVPEKVRGYLFEYEIVKNDHVGVTLRYNERVYKPGSDSFACFKETEGEQMMSYSQSQVPDAHELWIKASAKCNAKLYADRELLRVLTCDGDATSDFDVSDIEEFFQKYGKGTHFLEYDFTADTPEPVTYKTKAGVESYYHCWTHKYTKESVKRFAQKGSSQKGRSATDSGRLSKYLLSIKEKTFPLAFARAQKILSLNESPTVFSPEECNATPVIAMSREQLLKQQVR